MDDIFIDEISMVADMSYRFFIVVKRCKPNIKFIVAGDFNQSFPVNDRIGEVDYKHSSAFHEPVDGNRIQLSRCRRSDDVLFKMLNPKKIMKLNNNNLEMSLRITAFHLLMQRERKSTEQ